MMSMYASVCNLVVKNIATNTRKVADVSCAGPVYNRSR